MREGKIPLNWTNCVQLRSQISSSKNIDLKDTWFTPDLDEDPSKTSNQEPSVAPENSNNTITLSQSVPHLQERTASEGTPISEVIDRPASEGVQKHNKFK